MPGFPAVDVDGRQNARTHDMDQADRDTRQPDVGQPVDPGGLVNSLRRKLSHRLPGLMEQESYTRAAVLLPLLLVRGQWHLLFEVRARNLRRQPGEICFPGGHLEPGDADPQAAAVRETCEELNLKAQQVQVLGPLDVLITPWRLILHPYVGVLNGVEEIRPAEQEIDRIFTVPLQEIRAARPQRHWVEIRVVPGENFPFDKIPGGRNYPWRRMARAELFFEFGGNVVWGLTARVLEHFRGLLDDDN